MSGKKAESNISRRAFMAGGTTAMTAIAAGLAGASPSFVESLLRRRFVELSPEEVERIVKEMEQEYSERYGKEVTVATTGALPGVLFGYALDLSRCVGCPATRKSSGSAC
jgi:hypothetical protein